MPRIDSPTVFAALLDDEKGGYFKIQPANKFEAKQYYLENTNVLCCDFKTDTGQSRLIDFMYVPKAKQANANDSIIHRCVKSLQGRTTFNFEFFPKPNYARDSFEIIQEKSLFILKNKEQTFYLKINSDFEVYEKSPDHICVRFAVDENKDQHIEFIEGERPSEEKHYPLEENINFWRHWIAEPQIDVLDEYKPMVLRSLLTLKLLIYEPSGSIAAAATTSLPESIGAERNWDYRFCWIRDSSLTLKSFYSVGYLDEARAYENWLYQIFHRYGCENLKNLYGVGGEIGYKEILLNHLKGYKNSRPVRIGNNGLNQLQLDIFGEIMDSALRVSDKFNKLEESLWPFYEEICEKVVSIWQKPDSGIWEMTWHLCNFVYSKVMCWVALDRGLTIAKRHKRQCDMKKWEETKNLIYEEILENGFNNED
jgi:GH15 family glucan-1,4-alpha-glucosidase